MITISKEIFINSENSVIDLKGIAEGFYKIIVILEAQPKPLRPHAGFSKARFALSKDFNAPLEDFKEYMV